MSGDFSNFWTTDFDGCDFLLLINQTTTEKTKASS